MARASLLGLLSPIVVTVTGWLVLDQGFTPVQIGGAALVLGALWLGQQAGRPTPTRPTFPALRPTA